MGSSSGSSTARTTPESTRVLCVDDDDALVGLISTYLERESDRITTAVASSGREGLARIEEERVDCIVSDYEMPGMDGLEFLDAIRADEPDLPFILFTGKGSEEVAAEAISRGVTDYLQKETGTDQYAVLANRIHNVVDQYRAEKRSEARRRQLKALHRTTREALTAESPERVCEIGAEAVCDVLGVELTLVYRYHEARNELLPVAVSDRFVELYGDAPTHAPGSSIAWRVYEDGDSLYLEDIREDPDVYDPGTPIRSGMFLSLGDHGVLIAGAERTTPFDRADRMCMELLASNLTATLDRTERETLLRERERKLEQEVDRLSQIGNIVSHDLRNPLNVANGHLELARLECDDPHVEDYLETIDEAHARAFEIVENVMAFAEQRHGTGDIERLDLADVARRCWHNVRTPDAEIELEEPLVVEADVSRLKHLFENLFRNAVEHGSTSPDSQARQDDGRRDASSEPSVADAPEDAVEHSSTNPDSQTYRNSVERDSADSDSTAGESDGSADRDGATEGPDDGRLTVRVGPLPDGSGFYVEDDGVGIPPDLREEIFDIGFSSGTDDGGFGLSIVEHVCEAHGWDIVVSESEDGGARFEITDVTVVSAEREPSDG